MATQQDRILTRLGGTNLSFNGKLTNSVINDRLWFSMFSDRACVIFLRSMISCNFSRIMSLGLSAFLFATSILNLTTYVVLQDALRRRSSSYGRLLLTLFIFLSISMPFKQGGDDSAYQNRPSPSRLLILQASLKMQCLKQVGKACAVFVLFCSKEKPVWFIVAI